MTFKYTDNNKSEQNTYYTVIVVLIRKQVNTNVNTNVNIIKIYKLKTVRHTSFLFHLMENKEHMPCGQLKTQNTDDSYK